MKTIVHACGFNVNGDGWNELIIGYTNTKGRATAALDIALQLAADMSFGTGASCTADGRGEATATRDAVLAEVEELFPGRQGPTTKTLEAARLDDQSKNTCQEIKSLLEYALKHRCDMVIVVTDGTHATRVRNELSRIKRELGITNSIMITLVADADTDFGGGPENVVVFEPPVNPQDPRKRFPAEYQIHVVLPGLFGLFSRPANLLGALKEIRHVIGQWRSMED